MQNIVLIIVSVLLNCSAQLLIRKGMLDVGEISSGASLISNIPVMLTNVFLWLSMLCYGVSIIMWMVVLSKVEVSFAYPFLSIGYIISAVAGYMFFAESVTPIRIAGIVVICIGVILISRS
ncbi:MAG: EamA family transporter [Firmicutes bacterium]|nr:EamA family transporter [Bacillota bacterium]